MIEIGLAKDEKGRELKATELAAKMVVVVNPPVPPRFDPILITMWVSSIDPVKHLIRFYSATFGWLIENRYDQNGVIYDDQGRTVHVYEYLGEI